MTEPSRPSADAAGDDGFTLVEMLVAMAILAMGLAGILRALDGGWRGLARAEQETEALAVARNKLAAAGVEYPLVEGLVAGTTVAGVAWEIDIRARPSPPPRAGSAIASQPTVPALFDVMVRAVPPGQAQSAATPGTAAVELATIKLGARP